MEERIYHTIAPHYDKSSRILILGSFPSPKSRELGFYYGHPQNRFWRVISAVLGEPLPSDTDTKKQLLTKHHIALWDALASCIIHGADDASIKSEIPNDLTEILNNCNIRAIFATGGVATTLYKKHCLPVTQRDIITLPSTSPANCRCSIDQLVQKYKIILDYLMSTE